MKKKVCFVQLKALAYFMPELEITPGGAERQIYLLSTHLAKDPDWDVHVCVADYGQEACLEKEGVKLWSSVSMQRSRALELLNLYRVLKKIDANVYVFRSVDLGVAVGIGLTKLLNKKIVYMVANADEANPAALKKWAGSLSAKAMSWAYSCVDGISVQTQDQAEDFLKYRGIKVDEKVPNLFIGPELKRPFKSDRELVLWVGRSDPLKRPDKFIDLAVRFPEYDFLLISPATSYKEYSHIIEQKSMSLSNLTLLGRQSREELFVWYQKAALFVNTSVSEGFSNAMLEALYFEIPQLTMGVDPDGIIQYHQMGFVEPEQAQFDIGFRTIMESSDFREKMGTRGFEYVTQNHSPDAAMLKFKSLLKKQC